MHIFRKASLYFVAVLSFLAAACDNGSSMPETVFATDNRNAESLFADYQSVFSSPQERPNELVEDSRIYSALKSLELAAASGHSEAQLHLGFMLITGTVLPENRESGTYWLLLSAQQGNLAAQRQLGKEYARRERDPVDDEFQSDTRANATHWLEKAGQAGDYEAQELLGVLLVDCEATRRRGLEILEAAAERGSDSAREALQLGRPLTGDALESCGN
jgi:TPR repeat protein